MTCPSSTSVSCLTPGMRLTFRLRSEVTYKDKVNYRSIAAASDVFVRDHLGRLVKVAYVDFERDESHSNPVVAYVIAQQNLLLSCKVDTFPFTVKTPRS